MINLVIRILVNGAALIVASMVVPNIHLTIGSTGEAWLRIGAVALVFALINTYLRPIVRALSIPISLVTMGLVGLVINAAMLLVLSLASERLGLPFKLGDFPPTLNADTFVAALIGGVIISVVATVLSFMFSARKVFGIPL